MYNLFCLCSISSPIVMSSIASQIHVDKMSFLCRVAMLGLRAMTHQAISQHHYCFCKGFCTVGTRTLPPTGIERYLIGLLFCADKESVPSLSLFILLIYLTDPSTWPAVASSQPSPDHDQSSMQASSTIQSTFTISHVRKIQSSHFHRYHYQHCKYAYCCHYHPDLHHSYMGVVTLRLSYTCT